jgi:uncharacterized protein (TIRG00374 family)
LSPASKRLLKLLLRAGIGIGLVVFLLNKHQVPIDQIVDRLTACPVGIFLAAWAVDILGRTLCAFRWSRITALAGNAVPFGAAWKLYFAGAFFNTCLPTNIGGDAIRIVGLARHTGSKSVAFASVFMDRNLGMGALLLLGLVSSLVVTTSLQATLRFISSEPMVMPLWPLFLLLIAGYVLANLILFRGRIYAWFEGWVVRRLPAKVQVKVAKLHNAIQQYRRPLTEYAGIYGISLVYQISEAAFVWLLAWGLGFRLPFWVFGAMVTFQAVAGLLPISINNIGVREGIFCAVLLGQAAVLGLEEPRIKDGALALSLLYLAIIVATGLLGGLVYMAAGMTRPTEKEVEEAETGEGAGALPASPSAAVLQERAGVGK